MPAILKRGTTTRALILDPAARIKQLSDHGSSVHIDKAIPVKMYFRSGSEMERQVNIRTRSTGPLLCNIHVFNASWTLY